MGLLDLDVADYVFTQIGQDRVPVLDQVKYEKFSPELLGLGPIDAPSTRIGAICAVCDLSGFTALCSRPDPHLNVPRYLRPFLVWLFDQVKSHSAARPPEGGKVVMRTPFPFFAKFMGDGVLFLWNTFDLEDEALWNVVSLMWSICGLYEDDFLPEMRRLVAGAPTTLRCGISRGDVLSVGNRADFVGSCMNMAARLQKLSLLSFAFAPQGANVERWAHPRFVQKNVEVRGLGDHLVWVGADEFRRLPDAEQHLFREP